MLLYVRCDRDLLNLKFYSSLYTWVNGIFVILKGRECASFTSTSLANRCHVQMKKVEKCRFVFFSFFTSHEHKMKGETRQSAAADEQNSWDIQIKRSSRTCQAEIYSHAR